jgi:hypothetical protein
MKPKIDATNFDAILDQIVNQSNSIPDQFDYINNINDNNNPAEIIPEELNNTEENDINNNETNNDITGINGIPQKLDLIALNNGWNDKNEKIIISIGENSASYKWMHERSATHYKTVHKSLSIVLILLTSGLSAETVLPGDDSQTSQIITISRNVITYIITIISVLQNFLKLEQMHEQHMTYAASFSKLYHEIQQQMCMYRRNRRNATKYLADTLKRYDNLVINGPNILKNVINNFKNSFKNSSISLPDIADRIEKIEIISEPVQTTVKASIQDNKDSKRYGRYGICNLNQIHNAFQIHGDITDKDLEKANPIELQYLRKKFLKEKSNFEFQRYLQHTLEDD